MSSGALTFRSAAAGSATDPQDRASSCTLPCRSRMERTAGKSAGFCGLSLLLGWWGIPWGPIWTIGTVFKNLTGGVDVTANVLQALNASAPIPQAPSALRS